MNEPRIDPRPPGAADPSPPRTSTSPDAASAAPPGTVSPPEARPAFGAPPPLAAPPPPLAPAAAPRRPRPAPDDPRITGEMTFLDHLGELRSVLMHSVLAALAGAIGGWFLAPVVLEDLIRRTVGQAVVFSPLEAFNERIKLALLIGTLIATPIVFYRLWRFVVPGLLKRERSLILPMAMASVVLFAAGVWAASAYLVPLIVEVMRGFMTPSMVAQIRVEHLLGFFYNMALACGLVFQLPLVLMTLTAIGLVTPGLLLRQWRVALVGMFLLTAMITPGDVVTAQVVMGAPMMGLYLVSVGLSWLVARRRRRIERARDEAWEEETHG